ncbi:DUF4174 domain-containing protein [Roseivivax sediminis]|uniref:DUF4174 domain-containing protein n=1 Tax=Roseivivax sediminis TaxID=936889 RepID=A0A1I1X122_9RHOB|nr:DUF4174 domain-containing protein [Roseivivax sediminis]SFE01066.1 protein of unknown function [Roseivivax sediminis]
MTRFLTILAALLLSAPALAADGTATDDLIVSAEGRSLDEFRWIKRPIVVFADNPADPRYVQQMQFIADREEALRERDVVVITDTDPSGRSAIRQELRPREFMLVLLAKDGSRVLRKPFPWSVREITRSIDKLPARQQEVRDGRNGAP